MSDTMILHHYETSPFSEKVRVLMGLKSLAWDSVLIPNMMPKPDLMPLTGGYRRTPVMQIGADIFCDTQVILAEIERNHPFAQKTGGLAWAVNAWADRLFFHHTVPIIFGALGDQTPPAFIKDREQLSGRPFDVAAMRAAAPVLRGQWRAEAAWLDAQLAAGLWLSGASGGLADAAGYMNLWFLAGALREDFAALTKGLPHLPDWMGRVRAAGHGSRSETTGEAALAIAASASPADATPHDPDDPLGLPRGAPAFVMADDYGRDRISGRLVAANAERVVLARDEPGLGLLHLHFPRVGYVVGGA
jgi:glutathione S-transferase